MTQPLKPAGCLWQQSHLLLEMTAVPALACANLIASARFNCLYLHILEVGLHPTMLSPADEEAFKIS